MHIPLYTLDWWKLNLASKFNTNYTLIRATLNFCTPNNREIKKNSCWFALHFLFILFLFYFNFSLRTFFFSSSVCYCLFILLFLCFEIPLFDMHFQVHAANQSLTNEKKKKFIFIFQYSCGVMWCGSVNVERYAHLRWNNHPFPCRSFPLHRRSFLRDYLNDCYLRPLCRLLVAYACAWCADFGTKP